MDDGGLVEQLRLVPFLGRLAGEHLRRLARYGQLVSHADDALVFRRGQPAARLFIVQSGRAALSLDDRDAAGGVVRLAGPGEVLGEACFAERTVYPLTARTVGPGQLIVIDAPPLRQAMQRHPEIALALLSEVSLRLLTLVRQITDLKMKTAAERLGAYLAELAPVAAGPAEIPLPFEKKLLASHLGMQPETLSRALLKLQAAGVAYAPERHAFRVRDVRSLRRGSDALVGDETPAPPPAALTRHPPGSRSGVVNADDRALVRATPLLAALADADIDRLLVGASVHAYPDGGLLFQAGDRCDRLFVVAAGGVRLFALSEDGSESTIEVVDPGTMFAEAALFASGRYPVCADALPGARLVALDTQVLRRAIAATPTLALKMLASLGRWHLHLLAELRQLRERTPAQRLAAYLLGLPAVGGGGDTRVVRLPMRKALIASRIGIAPESLSRALARLAELGVRSTGEGIAIADVDRLHRFADGDGGAALTAIKDDRAGGAHGCRPCGGLDAMLADAPTPPTSQPAPGRPTPNQATTAAPPPAQATTTGPAEPGWVAAAVASAQARLDVRPLLLAGEEPLPRILALAAAVPAGGSLVVEAPFRPLPLARLLDKQGFVTFAGAIAADRWRLVARRREAAATPADDVDLDLRGMAPPRPMLAILALIDGGERPEGFSVRLDREPVLLFAELAERGWGWHPLADAAGAFHYRLAPALAAPPSDRPRP